MLPRREQAYVEFGKACCRYERLHGRMADCRIRLDAAYRLRGEDGTKSEAEVDAANRARRQLARLARDQAFMMVR